MLSPLGDEIRKVAGVSPMDFAVGDFIA